MTIRTTIPESIAWVNAIYLLEVNDPLQGYDPDTDELGLSNLQAHQLANRTAYLKDLFIKAHLEDGAHVLRNIDFANDAMISEGKLNLYYPTQYLKSLNTEDKTSIDLLNSRIANVSGVSGSLVGALAKAVPLSWEYSDHGFGFEMFSGDVHLNKHTSVTLIESITGDESIDVSDSSNLLVGEHYVVHDGAGRNTEFLTVKEILTANRVLCEQELSTTRSSGRVGTTSWLFNSDGTATVRQGGIYVSSLVKVGAGFENTKLILRHNDDPSTYRVEALRVGSLLWEECGLTDTNIAVPGTRDDSFLCPGGSFRFRITVNTLNDVTDTKIQHICVVPDSSIMFEDDIRPPFCVTPAAAAVNVVDPVTLTASDYFSLYGVNFQSAQFQVASDIYFSNVVYETTKTGASPIKTCTLPNGTLGVDTVYYWRMRYSDADGTFSKWTTPVGFSTGATFVYVSSPVNISPIKGQLNIDGVGVTLVSSFFQAINSPDTHVSSQWQVSTSSDFSVIVNDSGESSINKTSYTIPSNVLNANTVYYWRVRHRGTTLGWSAWSSSNFTTKSVFAKIIGVAFVNGAWVRINELFEEVTANLSYFNSHPVYSGILETTISGNSMVMIPKFYYKSGLVPSGDLYGARYWLISDQPITGYSVHPAFFNFGQEKSGFWIGKYQAGDDSNVRLDSIVGKLPIVETDFVTLRNRSEVLGSGWGMWNVHQLSAIQLLILVELGNPDVQSLIGQGRTATISVAVNNSSDVASASWRGIVGLWGNVNQFFNGLQVANGKFRIWDAAGNKTWVDVTIPQITSGTKYPASILLSAGNATLFVGESFTEETASAMLPDKQNIVGSGTSIATHGGYYADGISAGLFSLNLTMAENLSNSYTGTRLARMEG